MEYIKLPHLPERKVNTVVVAQDCPAEILLELERCGIHAVLSPSNPSICDATKAHPDMNLLHLGDNRFICAAYTYTFYLKNLIGADISAYDGEICSPYPNDTVLNAAQLAKHVFLYNKSALEQMFEKEDVEIIFVNQGYTKCNIAVVTDNAIITEDAGIAKAADGYGIDVLLIKPGCIALSGFKYGFIGGACGKLDSDTIGLTGSLSYIFDKDAIVSFCRNHGVYITELSSARPYDIGSILPISYK